MADCGEVDCFIKGEYFKQPYSLTRYYNAVDKIKVSPEVVEKKNFKYLLVKFNYFNFIRF